MDGPQSVTGNRLVSDQIRTAIQAGRDVHLHVADSGPGNEPLNQVPLSRRDFQNRHRELAALVESAGFAAAPDETAAAERIVVVEGPPGIGKKALVRRFAALHGDRFTGGRLHVDCAEFGAAADPDAVNVEAMLVDVLGGLGIAPEHAPRSRRSLRLRYQAALAARPGPVLVVVENATRPAQVTAFATNRPDSLLLVSAAPGTDLSELAMDDAVFHRLDRLDDEHSTLLFQRTAGGPGQPALVRLCEGVPLALLVLAKRVARALEGREPHLVARLVEDDRRLLEELRLGGKQVVSAAFTTVYTSLPEQLRFAYRRLGLFPGVAIVPEAAGELLDTAPDRAAASLAALTEAHMLHGDPNGWYTFPNNLIRLHAREQAETEPAEQREAALERVLQYYLVRIAFADRAKGRDRTRIADHADLLRDRPDPFTGDEPVKRAFAWLDAERPNLAPVVQAAFDAGFLRTAMLLADGLTAYYPDRRDLTAWIHTGRLGADAARALDEPWAEARLRSFMSRALGERGEPELARAELDTAHRLAERAGDAVLQASVWEFDARLRAGTGDHAAALDAYRKARDLNARAGERRGVALTDAFSGDSLRALGRHAEARTAYDAALVLFKELGDARMLARTQVGLGLTLAETGDVDGARATLEAAIPALAGSHYEARIRLRLADLETDGEARRAHLARALEIYRQVDHPEADEIARKLAQDDPEDPAPDA
ncbi:tetratricopeptide repeat protein [Actinomadura hibisca]|uniref:tetratricopeptide repeat protein n=1 Tax=Actinomadura hibisca TaxID=68565 RepID=UPI000834E01F|nr:tetratricopeptide repeat protein [Actinomadura hibisca]